MNCRFLLDKMSASGYEMPSYVRIGDKEASFPDIDNDTYRLDTQQDVWAAALKIASCDKEAFVKNWHWDKVTEAAYRYGILEDIKKVAEFIRDVENETPEISTENEWKRANEWLRKNAEFLSDDEAAMTADYLLEKAAEINYIPSTTERFDLDEIAGNESMTPELQKLADSHIHKLASGNTYWTQQFAAIPYKEALDFLPAITTKAACGMPVLHPELFAKAASEATETEAMILDAVLEKHGQFPIASTKNAVLEVSDSFLAAL